MRIGFDAKRAFTNRTGLGNYSRFILENLLKFDVENKANFIAFTPKINKGLFENFPKAQTVLPKFKLLGSLWRVFFIDKDLEKNNISIFHGLSNEIPFFLNRKKTKIIVTIHDLIFLRYPQFYKPIDRWIYKQKFHFACKNAAIIIAISEQTKRDIIQFFAVDEKKIKVVYQNCSDIFDSKVSDEEKNEVIRKYDLQKPFILSVGSIEERKNQLNLVKAFAKLKEPSLDLVLIGGGKKYKDELIDYIEKHQIEDVKILSGVPSADLPAIYQSAHIFAYISLFEGFGIPIVEAIKSGIPVLAATGSCLEESGGKGAIYVNPLALNEITEAIQMLHEDAALRERLIIEGKKHIHQFNTEKIIDELKGIYLKLNA